MNSIKKLLDINNAELAANTPDSASWHADYADTSYIYIGNLDRTLKEADILTIFSQYGNPTHINLVKDKDTGKPRGFCYLKYEDQRSCVLAVDNFNGTPIHERPLKVDHVYYKLAKGQREDDFKVEYPEQKQIEAESHQKLDYDRKLVEGPKSEAVESGFRYDNAPTSVMDDDNFEDPLANMVNLKPRKRSERDRGERGERDRKDRREKRHRSEETEKPGP